MYTVWRINFNKILPTFEEFLVSLKQTTGLSDFQFTVDSDSSITFPMMPPDKKSFRFYLTFDELEKSVRLETNHYGYGYLLEASLQALINLGGLYTGKLDPLAKKKWIDVKDTYKEKSFLSDEDLSELEKWLKEKNSD